MSFIFNWFAVDFHIKEVNITIALYLSIVSCTIFTIATTLYTCVTSSFLIKLLLFNFLYSCLHIRVSISYVYLYFKFPRLRFLLRNDFFFSCQEKSTLCLVHQVSTLASLVNILTVENVKYRLERTPEPMSLWL